MADRADPPGDLRTFRLPSLGADMDEATLLAWRVGVGDIVHRGDIVAVVDTEKSEIDVETWHAGTVRELLVEVGATVPVGTALALFEPLVDEAAPATEPTAAGVTPAEPRVLSPLVRHLAERHGVDLTTIAGSGPGGVITRHDVEHHVATPAPARTSVAAPPTPARHVSAVLLPQAPLLPAGRVAASPLARRLANERTVDLTTVRGSGPGGVVVAADVERAAVRPQSDQHSTDRRTTMRRAIAELMARSKREIPHYYVSTEIDCTTVLDHLERRNADRPPEERVLAAAAVLRCVALAARSVPALNGYWVHDRFEAADHVHLGVAVSLRGGGLIAPAILDADTLDLDAIMAALRGLVERARSGRLRSTEMSAPTITVSNLGERGVTTLYGVIYPPQVALVGVGRITERPTVVDGELAARPMATVTLAADHRATDGQTGSKLLTAIERLIGEPDEFDPAMNVPTASPPITPPTEEETP
ncbi:MAG: 2-oxo acid dehydrogenase subunit E2 [Acidimicrobiales bacterium]|nr:2-oxo acid dehydrogenase subunit E2 [Acidimicrobiales bacterium]